MNKVVNIGSEKWKFDKTSGQNPDDFFIEVINVQKRWLPGGNVMKLPSNVLLPLSDYHQQWYYHELVHRFGKYKEPIKTMRQLEKSLKLPWYEIAKVVELDKHQSCLATDGKHVWSTVRCCKV